MRRYFEFTRRTRDPKLATLPHLEIEKGVSMNVGTQSLGFPITTALYDHARRRLQFGLTRSSDRIRRAVVRRGDENGPRGAVDKFCCIQVSMADAPVAVIKGTGPDLYAAIDRAADRVSLVVVRLDQQPVRQPAGADRLRWVR